MHYSLLQIVTKSAFSDRLSRCAADHSTSPQHPQQHHHLSSLAHSQEHSTSSSYSTPSCLEGPSTSNQPSGHTPIFHRSGYSSIYNRVPSPAPKVQQLGAPPPIHPESVGHHPPKAGANTTAINNHARAGSVSDSYSFLMSSSSTIDVPSPSCSNYSGARRSFHQDNIPQRNMANIVFTDQ
uniref:Uncharacterized protein n=1 Tax=Ditylenchus dipsaci TaxID=166011 RepID=A0A915DPC7_9BILA